jgi:hypothetical protein
MKTCLVCDLCLLSFGLNVHRVFYVLGVWSVFVFFLVLICFWFNCLFWFSFESNHGFRFDLGLNQFFRVNLIRFALDQVLRHCLVGFFLLKNFLPKVLYGKHTLRPILTILLWIKNDFFAKKTPK